MEPVVLRRGLTAEAENAVNQQGETQLGVMISGAVNGQPVSLKLSLDELNRLMKLMERN